MVNQIPKNKHQAPIKIKYRPANEKIRQLFITLFLKYVWLLGFGYWSLFDHCDLVIGY